jgi:hypothetical protein
MDRRPSTDRARSTEELIRALSSRIESRGRVLSFGRFMSRFLAGCVAFFLPGLILAPTRADIYERVRAPDFWIETGLWVMTAVVSAALVYRSAIPGLMKKGEQKWAALPLALVCALWGARLEATGFTYELASEMDLWRGRCGFVILAVGIAAGALLMAWARRAAPTHPRFTGVWAAVCAGSLGSFAMQIVCAHDNALHLLVWHVVPVALLAGAGAWAGTRWLRWGSGAGAGSSSGLGADARQ